MTYKPKDRFFYKAKEENFAARSVFKLQEIDQKYKVIRPKQKILDLGCAPGSWSQYASRKIGSDGVILGIDLTPVEIKLDNAKFVTADLYEVNFPELCKELQIDLPLDIVMSDMAPKTTGIRLTDQARSLDLCELALSYAEQYLKPGGSFICKLFHSDEFKGLQEKIRKSFTKVETLKPHSTRKISKEIFLIGLNKKN